MQVLVRFGGLPNNYAVVEVANLKLARKMCSQYRDDCYFAPYNGKTLTMKDYEERKLEKVDLMKVNNLWKDYHFFKVDMDNMSLEKAGYTLYVNPEVLEEELKYVSGIRNGFVLTLPWKDGIQKFFCKKKEGKPYPLLMICEGKYVDNTPKLQEKPYSPFDDTQEYHESIAK